MRLAQEAGMEPSGSGEDGPGQETVEKLGEEESQPHSRMERILEKRMDRRSNGKERENGHEREYEMRVL